MAIYKCSREAEPGITRIGRKRGSPDFKAQTVTTGSQNASYMYFMVLELLLAAICQ